MTSLITGANRGIGRALWERMSDAIGTSRTGSATYKTLDVTDPASHVALAESLNGRPIDLLVCNAGLYLDKGIALANYTPQMVADTMATNVTGVILTVQTLLPNLKIGKSPKIAIISSQMGSQERAAGGAYAYRASKAAVLNFARNLAVDLKEDGIAVGAYHPGWVRTDMGGSAATVSVTESADGLIARFNELSMETTGCFRSFDGANIPF